MTEPITITSETPVNKGLDYAYLKAEGTNLVQQLAGQIWTDYNEHDPGVTALEQLCYALTELSYRSELPLEDLLINKPGGRINTRKQALFIPRRILPCNPLTINDYRKLIVDRVPGVENVWLTPYTNRAAPDYVNGLYDVFLYVPGVDPPCEPDNVDETCKKTLRVYCRHRNLCEDVHSITILQPLRTVVSADVSIGESAAPEAILAGLFFNIGNFIAPELRREPLKSLMARGEPVDRIFNGPLLKNGFIDSSQLQPKAAAIVLQEVIRTMVRSPGVTSVRNVSITAGGRTIRGGSESIPVPESNIPQLDTQPKPDGAFTIRLFKNGIEYKPKPARVKRELDKLWAEYRRTYELAPQYEEFFAVPQGTYRDVRRYYSVQNQFPNVYGINAYGLPSGAPPVRQAQAKQFKGYLLAFEQLLADFFAQLAHARDLYSIRYSLRHTYFFQYLYKSVPGVEPLLKEDYKSGLKDIVQGSDPFVERRNRFLGFLLALYAESLDASSISDPNIQASENEDGGERLMNARLELLHHLVGSTHNRGRGFDYLAPPLPRNIAGMEIKSRIQLGMPVAGRRGLGEALDECGLELVDSDREASIGRPASRHTEHIEEHFVSVRPLARELSSGGAGAAEKPPPVLGAHRVTEEFVRAAAAIENYRVGSLPGEQTIALVCKAPSRDSWRLTGKYSGIDSAVAAALTLVEAMRVILRYCRQLYVVEHSLLRFAGRDDLAGRGNEPGEVDGGLAEPVEPAALKKPFVYDFTITAVISVSREERSDPNYRRFVRGVIRQNTPSHIVADYCFLDPCRMREFESLYWDWQHALRSGDKAEIAETSRRLRRFLRRCERGSRR